MTYVMSGRLRLWTERFGDPTDPTVLLIMGAEAQSIGWPETLVRRLVAGGRQVIRYDHRDTGQSDAVDFDTEPYAMTDLARDAIAVLDGHGIAAAHVVGASMGGVIGQWLAVHAPERVLTLTTMNTTPIGGATDRDLPPPTPALLQQLAETASVDRDTDEQRVAADILVLDALNGGELPFDREAARDLAERHFARARDWTRSANHHRAGQNRADVRPTPLSTITAPTLVVAGTADPIFPLPHAEALAEQIPNARLVPIPGMGHGFLSPGLAERVADLVLDHTASVRF
ncbi:pimeloyl-ACP methyl ester carboxylesterase [Micromonospora pisi]|uniref:Pimeloyl-ACP methyl ester carboxylesterase n=1 Tax=Micromonospora pisi TaxID=589240 RepID=A0A495JVZ3_9ACTN|nr:alpha/beta hydrolase [Micromonospora pisi]RKR93110.1 pimeloyl-ACP methyl ester carboxylesterase [Micromonospora pisi]